MTEPRAGEGYMNWRDPSKELPDDNENVAVMIYHWKQCWPLSAEIYFGEVQSYEEDDERHIRVTNNDYIGGGTASWYFYDTLFGEKIVAWCYSDEFNRPEFIIHDKHWGEER